MASQKKRPCGYCRGHAHCRYDPRLLATAILFAVICLAAAAIAVGAELTPRPNLYRISSVSVYDGDTLTADIHLGFGVALAQEKVRLLGFDAWEITRARRTVGDISEGELAKGKKARDALLELLGHGTAYLVPEGRGRDPYGRILARLVIVNDAGHVTDIAEQMIRDGHARTGALQP